MVLEIDGVPVGRAVADEKGAFALAPPEKAEPGIVRLGVADADPATDPALRTALELLGSTGARAAG